MEDKIILCDICGKVCSNDFFKSNCEHCFCTKCITTYFIFKLSK